MKTQLSLFTIALLMFCACGQTVNQVPEAKAEMLSVPVDVVAETGSQTTDVDLQELHVVADNLYLNGTLILPPKNHATVTLIMGGTIHQTNLIPGGFVRKGSVLATVENPDFIELQQLYAESVAQVEYLEAEYNRQKTLSEQEAASKKRYQESKADYLSMKSRKDASAAQLRMLGVNPDEVINKGIRPYLEITAPVSGYVTGVKLNIGKHFQAGEAICDIVDKGEVLLCLVAYEKDLIYLSEGQDMEFSVNGMGNQSFRAKVFSVGQEVDIASRSVEVYAKVNGSHDHFRPGMYVTGKIEKK